MKIKTAELTGPALNWAVAMCEGWQPSAAHDAVGKYPWLVKVGKDIDPKNYRPSTNWAQGGPIMEREGIDCTFHPGISDTPGGEIKNYWTATHVDYYGEFESPSLLEAVMRRYVANEIGDEVEIPEELMP